MSHHGREGERDFTDGDYHAACAKLGSAAALIAAIAEGREARAPHLACDRWLEANGYACKATRDRANERRKKELDAQIEKLRQERELLP